MIDVGSHLSRYRLDALLGEGGMGRVFRAYDTALDRVVAIKVLRAAGGASSDDLLREARAGAALHHRNVVSVFDVGQEDGTPYIVMELLEGKPLRAYVGDASIPLQTKLGWLLAVARVLGAAHARGLIHRDVKPDNIVVCTDGDVKVLDFGIATAMLAPLDPAAVTESVRQALQPALVEAHSAAPRVMGTPRFMGPEQLRGGPVDGRVDQYAWATMAYELVTGVHPWSTLSADVTMADAVLELNPKAPSAVAPSLPRALDALLMRALSKAPEHRFPTMEPIVAELEKLTGAPLVPVASRPIARRFGRRALLGTGAALVVGGGVAVALVVTRRPARAILVARPSPNDGVYALRNKSVVLQSTLTSRYLLVTGAAPTGAEGGWGRAPKVVGADASDYDRAHWKLIPTTDGYLIQNDATKRYLLSDGAPPADSEGGWGHAPKVVGADANYYNRAVWMITASGEGFQVRNVATQRLLFCEGEALTKSEGGWTAAPSVVAADANYYNRAIWRIRAL